MNIGRPICRNSIRFAYSARFWSTKTPNVDENQEMSERMKEFKRKLKDTESPATINEVESETTSDEDLFAPWPNNTNPHTGEIGGPRGPEPTRYGDWERKGRVSDF